MGMQKHSTNWGLAYLRKDESLTISAPNALEALKHLKEAEKQYHPHAAFLLGNCYERGLGTLMRSLRSARKQYEKAFEWGRTSAIDDIARINSLLAQEEPLDASNPYVTTTQNRFKGSSNSSDTSSSILKPPSTFSHSSPLEEKRPAASINNKRKREEEKSQPESAENQKAAKSVAHPSPSHGSSSSSSMSVPTNSKAEVEPTTHSPVPQPRIQEEEAPTPIEFKGLQTRYEENKNNAEVIEAIVEELLRKDWQGDIVATLENKRNLVMNIAKLLTEGTVVKKDPTKGVKLYEKLAAQGDYETQYKLALAFRDSYSKLEIKPDPVKALEYFQASAARKYGPAQFELAVAFLSGDPRLGLQPDPEKAKLYLPQAIGYCRQRNVLPNAGNLFFLGFCYENGPEGPP